MSYLQTDTNNGFPSINPSRGLIRDPSLRRSGSLTRLDDLESSQTPRHVTFRPDSPSRDRYRSSLRSASPRRSSSPTRDLSPIRSNRMVTEVI